MRRIWAHAGEEFNVNSTPQLRIVLFDKLGLTPGEEDEDRTVDRRRLAPEDGRGPPDRRGPAAVPRGREAAQHVRRRAPAAHPRRRARARDVQADRHDHRSHLEREPEPPERPRAHRRRSRVPARVRRRRRLRACSPPTTRRSSCACSRTSPRTPGSIDAFDEGLDVHTVDRGEGVRRGRGRR